MVSSIGNVTGLWAESIKKLQGLRRRTWQSLDIFLHNSMELTLLHYLSSWGPEPDAQGKLIMSEEHGMLIFCYKWTYKRLWKIGHCRAGKMIPLSGSRTSQGASLWKMHAYHCEFLFSLGLVRLGGVWSGLEGIKSHVSQNPCKSIQILSNPFGSLVWGLTQQSLRGHALMRCRAPDKLLDTVTS
jgi:hypothetical protein